MEDKNRLTFRGSMFLSLIPVGIFFGFCIVLFVVFKAFNMEALAAGGFIALLIGGIYLIARKVIRIRIPLAYILTVAVLTLIFSRAPEGVSSFTWMLYEIFGGGLFLGAFFMATDYVTSPNTPKGEVIFGIGAGLLVVFIRYFGGYPEGVCYSILIMNICVWLIDKATLPKRFGVTAEMRKAEKEQAKAAKKAAKEGAEA